MFNKGDKVRRINSDFNKAECGKIYIVDRHEDQKLYIKGHLGMSYMPENFVLVSPVKPPLFKEKDIVKSVRGFKYVIIKVEDNGEFWACADNCPNMCYRFDIEGKSVDNINVSLLPLNRVVLSENVISAYGDAISHTTSLTRVVEAYLKENNLL